MKKIFLIILTVFSASMASAEKISAAKAVELACHRVERLVTLKKIDVSFLDHHQNIKVEILNPTQPEDPAFKTLVSQVPSGSGSLMQVEIFFNAEGKALSFNPVLGPPSQNAPAWPDKDPVTLMENALHYVLENWQQNADIKVFYDSMTEATVTPTEAGMALVEMKSSQTHKLLQVIIKADGTFVSAELK